MAPYWIAQVDVIAAFSLLGFVLITTPLFWLLRAWNTGCVLYIFWIGGRCLTGGINILLWRENTNNFAPVWCDIYVRFFAASHIGVISSGLTISHRLYRITNVVIATPTRTRKRRAVAMDVLIGLGIPALSVALYWFYEGHRFNIYEGVGCQPAIPTTFLSILLWTAWPIPIGLVSARYAFLTLRSVLRHTKELQRLQIMEPGLTPSIYYRVMALSVADILCTLPLAIYVLCSNIIENLYRYRGFADLHLGFGRVDTVEATVWRAEPTEVRAENFTQWVPIACAAWFFAVFGCTAEARERYKFALTWMARRLGISLFSGGQTTTGVADMAFQPHIVDSMLSDSTRDDKPTSYPSGLVATVDDIESKMQNVDRRCVLPSAATADSTGRIERSSSEDDRGCQVTLAEPLPVYIRSVPISLPPDPMRQIYTHATSPSVSQIASSLSTLDIV